MVEVIHFRWFILVATVISSLRLAVAFVTFSTVTKRGRTLIYLMSLKGASESVLWCFAVPFLNVL